MKKSLKGYFSTVTSSKEQYIFDNLQTTGQVVDWPFSWEQSVYLDKAFEAFRSKQARKKVFETDTSRTIEIELHVTSGINQQIRFRIDLINYFRIT